MSKEQFEIMKILSTTILKGIGIVLLTILGFLSVDAYTSVKENIKDQRKDLEVIKEKVIEIRVEQVKVRTELEQIKKDVNK